MQSMPACKEKHTKQKRGKNNTLCYFTTTNQNTTLYYITTTTKASNIQSKLYQDCPTTICVSPKVYFIFKFLIKNKMTNYLQRSSSCNNGYPELKRRD